MSSRRLLGSEVVCRTLRECGVRCVFGVPGSQTVGLFEALRRSPVRTVLTTQELSAAFMANGYYRASGEVAAVVTIPGRGFAYALGGIGEAGHDSAALVHITVLPGRSPRERYQLQCIEQAAMARAVVKRVLDVHRVEEIAAAVAEATAVARDGEPGPVLIQVGAEALASAAEAADGPAAALRPVAVDPEALGRVLDRLASARRPVILAGQGAAGAARELREVVEHCSIPVLTTPSGRGVLPEDHPFALPTEPERAGVGVVNALLDEADLILALGCKLSHNGTFGFALRLPCERLIRVNTCIGWPADHYPAALDVQASVEGLLSHLLAVPGPRCGMASTWSPAEVDRWRDRLRAARPDGLPEPALRGVADGAPAGLFRALRRALPRDGIVVTDTGLHQVLARRHFDVLSPRGLILPSDFQAMGFGVPAAIGAALAAPQRPVVAVVGDGGLLASGTELVTAVRERLPLVVIVFHDGFLNQIRLRQFAGSGRAHAVELSELDLAAYSSALGLGYVAVGRDAEADLRAALASGRATLVEVRVGDSPAVWALHGAGLARSAGHRLLGPGLVGRLKRLLGRSGS